MKNKFTKVSIIALFFILFGSASFAQNFNFGVTFSDPSGGNYSYYIRLRAVLYDKTAVPNFWAPPINTGIPVYPDVYYSSLSYYIDVTPTTPPIPANYVKLRVMIVRSDGSTIENDTDWNSWDPSTMYMSPNPLYVGSF